MKIPKDKYIVLFDGVCNLCNKAVQTIIKHDKKEIFVFASLQSEVGEKLLKERNIDTTTIDSIILIIPGEAYFIKSDAALEISKHLSGGYSILSAFSFLPRSFRDSIYDLIAKNRYKMFGKKESCMIPEQPIKHRFL